MSRPVNWCCFNLVFRVSHLTAPSFTPGGGKKRDPGNEVGAVCIKILRHVMASRLFELRLCAGSFFDFFPFSRHRLRYFVLSALDIGEYKRFDGNIYPNLKKLSLLFSCVNEHDFESICFGMLTRWNSYVLIC